MTPVGDPAALARTCAGCHVGAAANVEDGLPRRDVNHDLIAAGHPRLNFEFGAFLANLPPHWDEEARKKTRAPGFAARVWVAGQLVSAEAALELLADRAGSHDQKPWPEFAEYNCYACHHDLSEPSWRQQLGYGGRTPGSLPWSSWYYTMPRLLASYPGLADPRARTLPAALDELGKTLATPLRDQARLPIQARTFAEQLKVLQGKAAGLDFSSKGAQSLLAFLLQEHQKVRPPDWDSAEQLYLAAVALSEAADDHRARTALHDLATRRAYAEGFDSPKGFRPDQFLAELRGKLK
jgi:hypothetical protein